MSDYSDMYSYEEIDYPKITQLDPIIKTPITKGFVTELEINGKKFELVNPDYIRSLHSTIDQLTNNLKRAERTINTLAGVVRKLSQDVNDVTNKLDRKIDRI